MPRRPERALEDAGRRVAVLLGGDFFPWGDLGHHVKWRVRGRLAQIRYGRGDETLAVVDLRGVSPGRVRVRGDVQLEAAWARVPAKRVAVLDVDDQRLTLRIAANLQKDVELLALAESVGDLARALIDRPPAGVEWLGAGARSGSCLVCGDALGWRIVRCRSCRSPHHAECWRWIGACSTYACGERRCA